MKTKGKSIHQPFHPLPQIVFPANARGVRPTGLQREPKALGQCRKIVVAVLGKKHGRTERLGEETKPNQHISFQLPSP
jgi:hypothetical protein